MSDKIETARGLLCAALFIRLSFFKTGFTGSRINETLAHWWLACNLFNTNICRIIPELSTCCKEIYDVVIKLSCGADGSSGVMERHQSKWISNVTTGSRREMMGRARRGGGFFRTARSNRFPPASTRARAAAAAVDPAPKS